MAQPEYAHVHRSHTSKRPFLSLEPVSFSLTEGTDIPAPPPLPHSDSPSPERPAESPGTIEAKLKDCRPSHASPLSSHPVTPIENSGEGNPNGYPFQRVPSNLSIPLNRPQSTANDLDTTVAQTHQQNQPSELTHHQHNNVLTNNSPAHTASTSSRMSPPSDHKRRTSFASRFMRFRSFSSLRSKNDINSSNTSLSQQHSTSHLRNQYTDHDSGYGTPGTSIRASGDQLRGTKRPGSPGLDSNGDMGPPRLDRSRANSASFPRLMRKKSMEWFGTARRKSGMWANSEDRKPLDVSDFENDESMANGHEGDKDSIAMTESYHGDDSGSHLGRVASTRQFREPPPTIDELGDFGGNLDGQAMFGTIGRS